MVRYMLLLKPNWAADVFQYNRVAKFTFEVCSTRCANHRFPESLPSQTCVQEIDTVYSNKRHTGAVNTINFPRCLAQRHLEISTIYSRHPRSPFSIGPKSLGGQSGRP